MASVRTEGEAMPGTEMGGSVPATQATIFLKKRHTITDAFTSSQRLKEDFD